MCTHVHMHMHRCNTPCNSLQTCTLFWFKWQPQNSLQRFFYTCKLQYFSDLFENTNSMDSELSTLHLQVQHQINELNILVQKSQHVHALKVSTQHLPSAITVIKAIAKNSNTRSHTCTCTKRSNVFHQTIVQTNNYVSSPQRRETDIHSSQQTILCRVKKE